MFENNIIDHAIAALKANGIDAEATQREAKLHGHQIDAILRINVGGHTYEYIAEAKGRVTPATLGGVMAQLDHLTREDKRPGLLITEYITPPLAERLKALEIQFIDTVGNAYLKEGKMFLWITGRKPEHEQLQKKQRGAFTAAGLKVMFALICDPELANAPYRTIAEAGGVALGVITPVLEDLRKLGQLAVAKRNRRLICTKRLLDEWATAYARTLRPRTLLRELITQDFNTWQDWDLERVNAQWGGEPAASMFAGNLVPGVLTMYVAELPAQLIVTYQMTAFARMERKAGHPVPVHVRLHQRDNAVEEKTPGITFYTGGMNLTANVEIRKRFWGAALKTNAPHYIVPFPLIYADLLATGEARCMETARLIYDEHLARRFPAE